MNRLKILYSNVNLCLILQEMQYAGNFWQVVATLSTTSSQINFTQSVSTPTGYRTLSLSFLRCLPQAHMTRVLQYNKKDYQ